MKKIFILSFFLSFANILLGQISLTVKRMQFVKENQLDWKKRKRSVKVLFNKKNQSQIPEDLKKYLLLENVTVNSANIFTQKNASNELAFFCRLEEKIELKTNIPVRFRLGEVQAVDQKEGKWKQFQ